MNENQELIISEKTNTVRETLGKMKEQFALALPKHVTPEKLMRVTMTAIQNNPKLLECDMSSLLASIMTCAQLGLLPDGVLGQAYLIPFNKGYGRNKSTHCQVIVGYKGLLTLARQSGEIQSISARVVWDCDDFTYEYGLDERCRHIPRGGPRKTITHAYAVAKFKDGGMAFEVMTYDQIAAIMETSQGWKAAEKEWNGKPAKKNSVWHEHFEEMARKTVIRRIAKYLPMSVQKATAIEEAADAGNTASMNKYGDVIIEQAPEPAIEAPRPEKDGTERPDKEPDDNAPAQESEKDSDPTPNNQGEKEDAAKPEAFGPVVDCFGECSEEFETPEAWAEALKEILEGAKKNTVETKNIFKNNEKLLKALHDANMVKYESVMEYYLATQAEGK